MAIPIESRCIEWLKLSVTHFLWKLKLEIGVSYLSFQKEAIKMSKLYLDCTQYSLQTIPNVE